MDSSSGIHSFPYPKSISWTESKIYNFYTTMTFDKYGRLYSITKEVRVTVDTPTKVVWS